MLRANTFLTRDEIEPEEDGSNQEDLALEFCLRADDWRCVEDGSIG